LKVFQGLDGALRMSSALDKKLEVHVKVNIGSELGSFDRMTSSGAPTTLM
jgi:hypothetical protein